MRVLLWSENFWPEIGGIQVLATKLLPALQRHGFEFSVVTELHRPDQAARSVVGGTPVYRFPFVRSLASGDLDTLARVRRGVTELKRSFKPDLVHVNGVGVSSVYHLHTAGAHAAPALATLHLLRQDDLRQPQTLVATVLRSVDWAATCSGAMLAELRRRMPEITPRSSAIPNCLEPSAVPPTPLSFDAPRLLCLGRLVEQKGLDVALSAFARVARRYPGARLVFAGDGPDRPALEQQAAALGLTQSVEFLGWVAPEDVLDLINTAALVLMPSRNEGLPLAGLQAAQMGRPIVGTCVGGMAEIVAHGETGLLVEPEDFAALAGAIESLLERPDDAVRMGAAARHRTLEAFGWERHVEAYASLYRQLAESAAVSEPVRG